MVEKEFDVLAVGYICLDVITKGAEMPPPGRLVYTDGIYVDIGGSSANTGIPLARLGNRVLVGARVGNDNVGKTIRRILQDEGISVEGLIVDCKAKTSSGTKVFVDTSGERGFIHITGPNDNYAVQDIEPYLPRARHLHLGYFGVQKNVDMKGILRMAQESGLTTSLDTAGNPSRADMPHLMEYLKYTNIFVPSLEEAIALTGKESPEEIAQEFLIGSIEIAGVKLGKGGIYLRSKNGGSVREPIINVPVNTTLAAGDAAYAGLLHSYLRKESLKECAVYANATAALCVQGVSKERINKVGVEELVRKRKDNLV